MWRKFNDFTLNYTHFIVISPLAEMNVTGLKISAMPGSKYTAVYVDCNEHKKISLTAGHLII